MKNDDLERLEEKKEIQQLIRFSREQYEQEKSASAPISFSSVMKNIRQRQTKRVRRKISPWWLTAACLLGCVAGYALSGTGRSVEPERLAVTTDTVVIVRERVDTVYREVQPKMSVVATIAVKHESPKHPASEAKQKSGKNSETETDFISPDYLQQRQNMPNPESEYYAANGMTIAEGDYPIHLLGTAPCR